MVGVDSDVILIEMRYGRDARHAVNAQFLRRTCRSAGAYHLHPDGSPGAALVQPSASKLARWQTWLIERYRLAVLWPNPGTLDAQGFMFQEIYQRPIGRMQAHRMGFADALAIEARRAHPGCARFRHLERAPLRKQDPPAGADARAISGRKWDSPRDAFCDKITATQATSGPFVAVPHNRARRAPCDLSTSSPAGSASSPRLAPTKPSRPSSKRPTTTSLPTSDWSTRGSSSWWTAPWHPTSPTTSPAS